MVTSRRARRLLPAVCLVAVGWSHPASGAGYSADIELVRPTFSSGAPLGLDSPLIDHQGTFRYGLLWQFEKDPLVLYRGDDVQGSVIAARVATQLGVSYDLAPRVSARATLPIDLQSGTDVPEWAADGFGLGDFGVGMRFAAVDNGPIGLAFTGDLYAPTGRHDAWMGETHPRGTVGTVFSAGKGPFAVTAQAGVEVRATVDTQEDFVLGPELLSGAGARWSLYGQRVAFQGSVVRRDGLGYIGRGGAENAMEGLAGVAMWPRSGARIDAALGHGLGEGYGTTSLRILFGLTVTRWGEDRVRPTPKDAMADMDAGVPDQVAVAEDVDTEPKPPEPAAEAPKEWADGELARVQERTIEIRDPIQFAFNTAHILPTSQPTLDAIAKLLDGDPTIAHVLIEGHASEEGSYAYNYKLSNARAEAVFEALVEAGVDPTRLSWRGMGEVGPADKELAANRRVVFQVIRVLAPGATPPATSAVQPWNGEPVPSVGPVPPAPAPAPAPAPDPSGDASPAPSTDAPDSSASAPPSEESP